MGTYQYGLLITLTLPILILPIRVNISLDLPSVSIYTLKLPLFRDSSTFQSKIDTRISSYYLDFRR